MLHYTRHKFWRNVINANCIQLHDSKLISKDSDGDSGKVD